MTSHHHYDVVILGAGLAGLSLARHLLLETDKNVLVLERRESVPGRRQKVGESTVQLGGYYFSKVLDLEEHLLSRHYIKNNLRFHWKNAGRDNRGMEEKQVCSQELQLNHQISFEQRDQLIRAV